ncbi:MULTISPECIES: hypothetical protein [Enterococcus]|nr:hypothetical protein [Enterococcus faecium]QMX56531.1 hypothetical protein HI838_014880 [Enterococcus faecium]QOJ75687.1 hypothetical protein IG632_14880 [Enterococcus faecium]QTQ92091.1 hypothetical protein J7155_14850 [Enterococcus faecium]HCR2865877.1 hypothetical protein [Enterococcus faecium]
MIKDKRKTKENSKNQEQFINWIKEYFEKAPITITNDKTKLYIAHKNYPISLENTSIIEKFTNKNKGVEFTKEQATKEAENLRNELAVEVKNYKTLGISVAQKLIKEHIVKTFGLENITDIKFIGDYVVSFEYNKYEITSLDFDNEVYSMFKSNTSFEEFELSDLEDYIDNSEKYWEIAEEIIENSVESYVKKLEDTDYAIEYSLDYIDIYAYGSVIEAIWNSEGADMTIIDTIDFVIEEVKSVVDYILSNLKEQAECAEYAEENYEKDIKELVDNLVSDIKKQYPDFEIDYPEIYVQGFSSNFECEIEIYNNIIKIDTDYPIFTTSGFWYSEEVEFSEETYESYLELPYGYVFDYYKFLDIVEEKLNEIKEEILEDLSV